MPKPIGIRIPESLVAEVDLLAQAEDRSRTYIIVRAIRAELAHAVGCPRQPATVQHAAPTAPAPAKPRKLSTTILPCSDCHAPTSEAEGAKVTGIGTFCPACARD